MQRISVLLFSLLIFLGSFLAESIEISEGHSDEIIQIYNYDNIASYHAADCDDCSTQGCPTSPGHSHCSHHCSGLHFLQVNSNNTYYFSQIINNQQNQWFYYFRYSSPTLDPALKPPLFS